MSTGVATTGSRFAHALNVIFAVLPGLAEGGWTKALLWGGLFGLFAYGTYDLTNLATLKNWSSPREENCAADTEDLKIR